MRVQLRALVLFGFAAALTIAAPAQSQSGNNSIFKAVPTPNENFNNDLLAASANSPSDIWAVGQSTIHFDGTKWTPFPAPMIQGNNTSFLGGVVDISPTLAWAAGSVNPTKGGFLSDLLWAGVVPSAGNVWIVGTEDEAPHGGTLAIHTLTGN
jgi:hypothetical protein